ncbi:integral membrane sensor signal transduction histidine kinase [Gluconacetobacter diazotrophicus PA1 5]|uniref:histidine kinase n=2 Tax=Gluconacetobacter diazotrophicus TaxID=33996 RepID=A9HFA0_GLUDA|nr:ATP-binding protein [Gluconacetobacter diazotrophicus]ACI51852.1 integral membrane sensor signal transduction histidine kinase [Gluconacetobacter diazotrophicus PA1 5]MBB2155592.1 HAMP domain-containing protein [Gluconacetobacter diazotrophicus]TWB11197.1 signal transduction histidine kinase [Gluconacetobacter diazotrophicus]CAP55332.1 putative histidine kinase [Gluconacetobacter diazotrophicus PA1 5]
MAGPASQNAPPGVRRITLWPRGLVGRVTVVLLAAVALVFIGSSVFYEEAETYTVDDAQLDQIGERLTIDARVLLATPVSQRPILATMLSTGDLTLDWSAPEPVAPPRAEPPALRDLHGRLAANHDFLRGPALNLAPTKIGTADIRGILRLPDGSRIGFVAPDILQPHHTTRGVASAAVLAGAVLMAAAMLVHTLSMPLRALADVADGVGSGQWIPVEEKGPREVRYLARAINAMQDRIRRLIADRTEALAAVSHDLRTPLARLRLRAGFLDDPEVQGAIESDVAEMEAMVGGVLAYLSGENDPESARPVDLASILMTLADDAADQGRDVSYDGPPQWQARVRPLAMKRVFGNLIDNAVNYGRRARIRLSVEPRQLRIRIDDDGPGLPEAELTRVLTPFYRVEGSRSRATGGLGLGLAIVNREVAREGGQFVLSNRTGGGLRAEILLPRTGHGVGGAGRSAIDR